MTEKNKGLFINLILYFIAFAIGFIPFMFIDNIFLSIFVFTITSTFVIFISTCFYPDTSLYDPYWSVAPPVLLISTIVKYKLFSINSLLLIIVVLFWAIRLTVNWAYTYKGLGHEDWRYASYRQKTNKFVYGIINFFGLQYMPTIVVYIGLAPAIFIIQNETFNPLLIIGLLISILGVVLEIIADTSIHKFLIENKGKHTSCNISIWKYSRHPNYLGEITFWNGLFISFILTNPNIWYYCLGSLLIDALFMFISIPMMEKHNMERRVDYAEYKKQTSMLIPLPRRK